MSGGNNSSSVSDDVVFVGTEQAEARETSVETSTPLLLSVGQQLRAAREAKGLAVADIGKTLKLSPHQVEALEADDWSRLPCKTIIRGFVRNYARLVSLNSDGLMITLDSLHLPQVPELEMPMGTNIRVPQEGGVEKKDYLRVISGLIVLALAVLAYFFFPVELWQSAVTALKSATQSNEGAVVKAVPQTKSETKAKAAEVIVTPPVTAVLSAESVPPVQVPPAAPPSALPSTPAPLPVTAPMPQSSIGKGLKFSFTQPSWVEVRDKSGEIIFSQLNQAGSRQEIDGQPPFALVIGNAGQVTLQYKGKKVDLSKRSKDDVVRVTVE